jgi:hypothetical protein
MGRYFPGPNNAASLGPNLALLLLSKTPLSLGPLNIAEVGNALVDAANDEAIPKSHNED